MIVRCGSVDKSVGVILKRSDQDRGRISTDASASLQRITTRLPPVCKPFCNRVALHPRKCILRICAPLSHPHPASRPPFRPAARCESFLPRAPRRARDPSRHRGTKSPRLRVRGGAPRAKPDGYFATPLAHRAAELETALRDPDSDAVICARGGYGSSALLDRLRLPRSAKPKLLIGYSDITALQVISGSAFAGVRLRSDGRRRVRSRREEAKRLRSRIIPRCRQRHKRALVAGLGRRNSRRWRSVRHIAGRVPHFDANNPLHPVGTGYPRRDSAARRRRHQTLPTRPYAVTLAQAGKFRGVRGIILSDFPEAKETRGGVTIRDVCRRMLGSWACRSFLAPRSDTRRGPC